LSVHRCQVLVKTEAESFVRFLDEYYPLGDPSTSLRYAQGERNHTAHAESPRVLRTQHLGRNRGSVSGRQASPATGLRRNFSWHPGQCSPGLEVCLLDSGSRPAALPGMTGCHKPPARGEAFVSEQRSCESSGVEAYSSATCSRESRELNLTPPFLYALYRSRNK
jgi:hypothetical protein